MGRLSTNCPLICRIKVVCRCLELPTQTNRLTWGLLLALSCECIAGCIGKYSHEGRSRKYTWSEPETCSEKLGSSLNLVWFPSFDDRSRGWSPANWGGSLASTRWPLLTTLPSRDDSSLGIFMTLSLKLSSSPSVRLSNTRLPLRKTSWDHVSFFACFWKWLCLNCSGDGFYEWLKVDNGVMRASIESQIGSLLWQPYNLPSSRNCCIELFYTSSFLRDKEYSGDLITIANSKAHPIAIPTYIICVTGLAFNRKNKEKFFSTASSNLEVRYSIGAATTCKRNVFPITTYPKLKM